MTTTIGIARITLFPHYYLCCIRILVSFSVKYCKRDLMLAYSK